MWDWLPALLVKLVPIGPVIKWLRSSIVVTLETHIEQSMSDREVSMSITNHGNTDIIIDEWTVHMPISDVFPEIRQTDDTPQTPRPSTFRIKRYIASRSKGFLNWINRKSDIDTMNEWNQVQANSLLGEHHWRHQLLGSGHRQRIPAGESLVRRFPQSSVLQETMPKINVETITIIPSCHIVRQRGRIWGGIAILGGGPVPISLQFNPPSNDDYPS